ncbi:androglobin-like isoform X2 [Lycorma delicatula]|uniref:androglobin-like isoform X2 n=1 Tax=Lycorma delicatula TaxID=130591 RepID=UPI003F50FB9A
MLDKLNIFIIQKLMNADIQSAFLPPWPEWDDAKINAEKWGSEVGTAVDSAKQKKEAAEVKSFFEDPSGHGVLPKLVTTEWRRPKEINPNINYTVSSSSDLPDIFSKNTHILGSDELQAIMLCILFLDKVAQTSPFPIEFQSAKFSFPDGIPWKPWHHIYSNCKIVKGAVHKPEYNNYGKYIVRLFFLGKWRQVTVDDFMPLDEEGRVLLPVTRDPKELWLPILTKAVLKVLLVIDSNCIICSLTGWLKIPVSYLLVFFSHFLF